MKYPRLFQEGAFGSLKVKNRLVMPPMVRNYADTEGRVTDRYVAHIARVAGGGVGTMILEASYVRPDGKGFANQLGIHADATLPGLKRLVEVAHAHRAAIGPQLYHAGRQTSFRITGTQPVGPSAIPDPSSGEIPRALTAAEIPEYVAAYAAAAARAKKAGFDFVEIHGAHGYLITQFLSAFSNRRTDGYGGTLEKRMRFLREVHAAVREAVGKAFPVLVRLSGDEMVPGGLTIKESAAIAARLERDGADAIHVSAGNYASYNRGRMIAPMAVPDGPLVDLAAAVRKSVRIPVIAVGKLRTPALGERLLKQGKADFIAIGRTLLADPEWPNKVKEGREGDIMPCVACNQGCIGRLFDQKDVWCTVNPETGRETAYATPSVKKKRLVVIGGGPAGLQAAKTAAQRGHHVVLFEKEAHLGGQLGAAGAAPHREDWLALRDALVRDVRLLGVEVRIGAEPKASEIIRLKPDLVIDAVGSAAAVPKIPGVGRTTVVTSRDLLEGRGKAKGRVTIVGGGCAGAQTAEFLAKRGHHVTLIEASGSLASDAPSDERALLLARLSRKKVRMMLETSVMSIGPRSVTIENTAGVKSLPADTVVLCLGSFPNDGVLAELRAAGLEVAVVGDALQPRRVTDAMAEGAEAALNL